MIAVDSSVVVAAFASWHEHHEPARAALDRNPRLPAHAALETYSVLTRLPAPHRAPARLVLEFLVARFPGSYLVLPPRRYQAFLDELLAREISGAAAYDALIAAVARNASATLVSCDRRAAATYQRMGVSVDYLG